MNMSEAVRSAFSKYATFGGRAGGTEYWWFVLFELLVLGAASILDRVIFGHNALFSGLCSLALLLPVLAVSVRRLHDTNRTGWWILLAFIPFAGGIVLLIWVCTPSDSGPNRFGPMPGAISEDGVAVW